MNGRHYRQMRRAQEAAGKFLCIGLDPDIEKIPESARRDSVRESIVAFNRAVIDATADIAGSYKPNSAFYEAHGDEGWQALRETIFYIREAAPDLPVILDAKRGDIGNTNDGYAAMAFEHLAADAITVHPYMGRESLSPFLAREDKGIFVLCRTSNAGAGEFQDAKIGGEELYKLVARSVAGEWNAKGNCGLVAGATYPDELRAVRALAPGIPILVPGIGAQSGDLEKSVAAGKDEKGAGIVIAAGRAIIYASAGRDFAEAARKKSQEFHGAIGAALLQ